MLNSLAASASSTFHVLLTRFHIELGRGQKRVFMVCLKISLLRNRWNACSCVCGSLFLGQAEQAPPAVALHTDRPSVVAAGWGWGPTAGAWSH